MGKKIISFLFALFLGFYSIFSSYVTAYAGFADDIIMGGGAAAVGGMTQGIGMASLMGSFGVFPTSAALGAAGGLTLWGIEQIEDYKQYLGAKSEYTSEDEINQAAANLVGDICSGVIDTTSNAYRDFKEWLNSILHSSSAAIDNVTINNYNFPVLSPGQVITYSGSSYDYKAIVTGSTFMYAYVGGCDFIFTYGTNSSTQPSYDMTLQMYYKNGGYYGGNGSYWRYFNLAGGSGVWVSKYLSQYSFLRAVYRNAPTFKYEGDLISALGGSVAPDLAVPSDVTTVNGLNDVWDKIGGLSNAEQKGISASGNIVTTGNGIINLNVPNALEKTDTSTMEELLEKIYANEIEWTKAMEALQVALLAQDKVIAQDTDGKVIEQDIDDRVPDVDVLPKPPVYDDSDFTIEGLETVFPFCIPFDLYHFLQKLEATPKAPHWVIKASFLGDRFKDYTIDIDLSKWDKMAEYARDGELLLYIIGLILLTRNIIRG